MCGCCSASNSLPRAIDFDAPILEANSVLPEARIKCARESPSKVRHQPAVAGHIGRQNRSELSQSFVSGHRDEYPPMSRKRLRQSAVVAMPGGYHVMSGSDGAENRLASTTAHGCLWLTRGNEGCQ